MRRSFNMGIGLIIVCASASLPTVLRILHEAGENDVAVIGNIQPGDQVVRYGALS
jgi:phosphoribosylaminoimidazole (AIR) synthetase